MNDNYLELYNYSGVGGDSTAYDLMKAMSAGASTGRDLNNTDTSGASLKTESLDPTLRVLTNTDKHIKFWKMIAKDKAYNTVEEFNQLKDYGLDVGVALNEGETPQFTDSIYTRRSVLIKYYGVSGEVTHPFTLVNLGSGVGNALAKEVQNKTQFLLRKIDMALPTDNSAMVSKQFDGIFAQHYNGIATTLDTYAAASCVIDARDKALTDANVEDAANAVVNDGFGSVTTIMGAPIIFNDYVKRFHESKRVMVNSPGSATTGATMGQAVNDIATQFGKIDIADDIFFDYKKPKLYNAAATNSQAPVSPVAAGVLTNAVTDTNTKFAGFASNYWYAVTSKNAYGESAMVILDTNTQAVAATEAVDLQFTQTDGSYASECFVIYRTRAGVTDYTTADFWPIMTVSKAQWTAGYDGGAAGLVRDRNRTIPGTYTAMVCDFSSDVLLLKQLAPIMRMDLARVSPAYRFMILSYLTPLLGAPKKIALIRNIGRVLTA
jgi:hypothetical protein